MATSQQFLICDLSTLANFKAVGSAVSAQLGSGAYGFLTQAADSGQVNWTTIGSVPTSGNSVYEIWQSNDGLTVFFLKFEYYNTGSSGPAFRLSLGTGTNGAGTLTGFFTSAWVTCVSGFSAPSTTTTYECDFSGRAGQFGAILWRNGGSSAPTMFSIERSVNSSGAYTGTHVTLIVGGSVFGASAFVQQTLFFGVGAAPATSNSTSRGAGGLNVRANTLNQSSTTSAFNNGIGFDLVAPYVGYFDYQLTGVGVSASLDITEAITFSTTVYGATRTYMPTSAGSLGLAYGNVAGTKLCLRYD